MEMLFSQEEVWEMTKRELKRDAQREGREEGAEMRTALLGELMKKLAPLGRIDDLIAATSDKAKLAVLASEFGLQI